MLNPNKFIFSRKVYLPIAYPAKNLNKRSAPIPPEHHRLLNIAPIMLHRAVLLAIIGLCCWVSFTQVSRKLNIFFQWKHIIKILNCVEYFVFSYGLLMYGFRLWLSNIWKIHDRCNSSFIGACFMLVFIYFAGCDWKAYSYWRRHNPWKLEGCEDNPNDPNAHFAWVYILNL